MLESVEMRFFRDRDGNPRVEYDPPFRILGSFLTEDLQDSPAGCREIETVIAKIFNGELETWRRVGNAHVLTLTRDDALIESLVAVEAEACRLSLEVFREGIRDWRKFLDAHPRS